MMAKAFVRGPFHYFFGAPKEVNANSYALYFFPGHFSCKLVA